MILYDYWRSSASYRVRIALNLKGLEFESRPVDLLAGAHKSPDHLKLNPLGRVPVFVDHDVSLTQSGAILQHLERYGSSLWPENRARCQELVDIIACDIHPICNLGTVKAVCQAAGEDIKVQWMVTHMKIGLDALEAVCPEPQGPFCFGAQPSMFEVYLIPQLYNAQRWGMDIEHWPKLARLQAECSPLEAFAAAHPDKFQP